ncbi:AAEL000406-PA [Aedes aegypti]|uniref:AAEL000406-PA n=2 Tax=Aedes aegypti TaxID=7159 RepID=A0A1S4EVR4_AEDAE|nr:proteoglycan 4 [Aedes aegypti]EAT48582.1 AAEL000406-PA [Aedes aegypti]
MGLKLKWFRRRITFEGIPSAPERNIRRKENTSGFTAVGVYRQSVNFEDYIEPSRASYGEPPSQPFVTTTIRKPNTSTTSSTIANKSSEKNNVGDKIARQRRSIETPPEPNYLPPKPPMRRAVTKTKSTPNISTLEEPSEIQPIETTRSIEVLNDVPEPQGNASNTQTSRAIAINYNAGVDSNTTHKLAQNYEVERIEHWKQQQPEFFNEILEKVNEFANTSKPVRVEEDHGSETESYDEIFEKVKAKPRGPLESTIPFEPQTIITNSIEQNLSRHTSASSVEDIFEPRPPEYMFAISMDEDLENDTVKPEVVPRTPESKPRILAEASPQPDRSTETSLPLVNLPETSPQPERPLKSILKKRAPAPPSQQPPQTEASATIPTEVPIPPPRTIRKQPDPAPKEPSDDDDDDYLNWNMIDRHRSSITHTVASQRINPETMKNVPASLQQAKPLLNTRAIADEEQPKTLREMRNRQPAPISQGNTILGLQSRNARDSESNVSEASA